MISDVNLKIQSDSEVFFTYTIHFYDITSQTGKKPEEDMIIKNILAIFSYTKPCKSIFCNNLLHFMNVIFQHFLDTIFEGDS